MRNPTFLAAGLAVFCMLAVPTPGRADDEDKKLKFSGDFRGRYEKFSFSMDETGSEKPSRSRLRYRFRFNMKATMNDHFKAGAQLTTGDADWRSGNQSLGSPPDFAPSDFDLRRAYVTYMPFSGGGLGEGPDGHWKFDFGRVPNPYMWKNGPDGMVWDGDIALTGASTLFDVMASENIKIFANTGYYVIDENSTAKDPYLTPIQAGIEMAANDDVSFGARGSYYYYDHLDEAFIDRASMFGNVSDGLTGDPMGGTLQIMEGQAFVEFAGSDAWPITAFGGGSVNTSAKASASVPEAGKADKAYNVGLDVGSKKKAVRLGAAWVHLEANSLVAQFTDSDYLDGVTNREGVVAWVQRTLAKNTDLAATVFWSDGIETAFADSNRNSERTRFSLDLIVKF